MNFKTEISLAIAQVAYRRAKKRSELTTAHRITFLHKYNEHSNSIWQKLLLSNNSSESNSTVLYKQAIHQVTFSAEAERHY